MFIDEERAELACDLFYLGVSLACGVSEGLRVVLPSMVRPMLLYLVRRWVYNHEDSRSLPIVFQLPPRRRLLDPSQTGRHPLLQP